MATRPASIMLRRLGEVKQIDVGKGRDVDVMHDGAGLAGVAQIVDQLFAQRGHQRLSGDGQHAVNGLRLADVGFQIDDVQLRRAAQQRHFDRHDRGHAAIGQLKAVDHDGRQNDRE